MSIINQLKSQSKTVLAAVAITAATVGFAGGMSISKSSTGVSTQNQASLAQNNSAATNGQANSIAGNQMPPASNGGMQGMPPGQGTTPPDATSGATQSNTSSDEVNALKEKNQEIKAQISGSSNTSNQ
ncbi:TPA: hypothetical protein U1344_000283 [Streptococcus suis]|nr:hypothetical protein [Streptococcus suis]HEM5207121.1 hypothetical protein [Streptococcus suis]HEM5226532.1 hypothetical protein [Streptococcus suis]HEM5229369.1 hypothetical protein [Streptococcus suis]HEM5231367.1 hypothetical protein [Streptococcus suis]